MSDFFSFQLSQKTWSEVVECAVIEVYCLCTGNLSRYSWRHGGCMGVEALEGGKWKEDSESRADTAGATTDSTCMGSGGFLALRPFAPSDSIP